MAAGLMLGLSACSFSIPGSEVANLRGQEVRTSDNERVPVPDDLSGDLYVYGGGDYRIMAQLDESPTRTVYAVPVRTLDIDAAEKAGWSESHFTFEGANAVVAAEGSMLYIRKKDGPVVGIPVQYVENVMITDRQQQRFGIWVVVIASISASVIATVAFFASDPQLGFAPQ